MNAHEGDRIKKLLQQALPPVDAGAEPDRDLWPSVLRRIDAGPAADMSSSSAWFDGALLAGLLAFTAFMPASIPVILYYL
jgi:hypothetical protein